jgi:hypothetical protein
MESVTSLARLRLTEEDAKNGARVSPLHHMVSFGPLETLWDVSLILIIRQSRLH